MNCEIAGRIESVIQDVKDRHRKIRAAAFQLVLLELQAERLESERLDQKRLRSSQAELPDLHFLETTSQRMSVPLTDSDQIPCSKKPLVENPDSPQVLPKRDTKLHLASVLLPDSYGQKKALFSLVDLAFLSNERILLLSFQATNRLNSRLHSVDMSVDGYKLSVALIGRVFCLKFSPNLLAHLCKGFEMIDRPLHLGN